MIETEWVKRADETWIMARYGFHNDYFSITGETRDHRGMEDSCGCIHKDIAQAFPELKDLIKWHLTDAMGVPMHYIANGVYWLQTYLGHKQWKGQTDQVPDPTALQHFLSHIIYGMDPEDEEKFQVMLKFAKEEDYDEVKDILESRKTWLRSRIFTDMQNAEFPLEEETPWSGV